MQEIRGLALQAKRHHPTSNAPLAIHGRAPAESIAHPL